MTNSNRNEKAIVLSIYGLVLSSIGILGPILPLYLTSLDIHPQELGLLFSCHMVAVAMGELIWGRVIDKVGMNVAMFTSTFIVAGFSSLFLIVESLPWLFILFFCLGFARAAIFISGRWYVAVNSPPSERASSMALVTAIFFGTRSISSILGGVLVDQWG
jgi:MFS family permease